MSAAWNADWDIVRPIDNEPDDTAVGFRLHIDEADDEPSVSTEQALARILDVIERHTA